MSVWDTGTSHPVLKGQLVYKDQTINIWNSFRGKKKSIIVFRSKKPFVNKNNCKIVHSVCDHQTKAK